jgi:hypothetical protein
MLPNCYTPPLQKYIHLKGLPNKKFTFENWTYLGEFEAEFKKALVRESGAEGALFDEKKKTKGRKSRDTVPLKGWSVSVVPVGNVKNRRHPSIVVAEKCIAMTPNFQKAL